MFHSFRAKTRKSRRSCSLYLERLEDRSLPSGVAAGAALQAYDQLPLSFEVNRGQTAPQVGFLSRGDGYSLFLTPAEAVLNLQNPAASSAALTMQVIDANPLAPAAGLDELPGMSNYFVGSDPQTWQANVANYEQVEYQSILPGINLLYYGNQRQLEYDFQVAPGADPGSIRLAFQGAESSTLDAQGDLVLHTAGGDVVEHAPVLYQQFGGVRHAVAGHYVLDGANQVSFAVGAYNPQQTLIIDPVLSYSTYLGGSGTDSASAIAVDGNSDLYIVGTTASVNFPTLNAIQSSLSGKSNLFVTELNPSGTGFVFSTYLGGSGTDSGNGIALDSSGNIYLAGTTTSTNFPLMNPLQATLGGGSDAFVTKLSPGGSSLIYSTYLGGSGNELTTAYGITGSLFGSSKAIAVDSQGDAYITGSTTSTNFPTVNALQPANAGGTDGFVSEINPSGSALVYSTYLGGSGTDIPAAIAVDAGGNVYVAGATTSTNFPTVNAFQSSLTGTQDAFVTKIAAGGSAILYSTYLGGSKTAYAYGLAVDSSGAAYFDGATGSSNFPTLNAFESNDSNTNGVAEVFVSKFSASGSLAYSTYLDANSVSTGEAITVDSAGDAWVTGAATAGFPVQNPIQAASNGGSVGFTPVGDAFLTELNPTDSGLIFSTYLGGSKADDGTAIAVDSSGNAYVAGWTQSTNFPTVNALQPSNGGGQDAFVARITFGPSLSIAAPATALAGAPFNIIVSALDASNNVNPNYTGTVHFTSSDALAVLPADYTFTSADQGVHTFTVTLIHAGTQTITATDTVSSTMIGQTGLAVTSAAATTLSETGYPSPATAGSGGNLTVTALDAYGNLATGYTGTVHFTSSDAKAVLPANYTFTATDAGTHVFSATLETAGTQSITATDTVTSSLTSTASGIVVNAAAAAQFILSAPSSVTHGVAFTVTLTVEDAYGNVVTGYVGTVHFSSSDSTATLPANYTFTASDAGVHSFVNKTTLRKKGRQTLTVTDTKNSALTVTDSISVL